MLKKLAKKKRANYLINLLLEWFDLSHELAFPERENLAVVCNFLLNNLHIFIIASSFEVIPTT